MRPIPDSLKYELLRDEFMQNCCLQYEDQCEGRLEWKHHYYEDGRFKNVYWGILPICKGHNLKSNNIIYKNLLNKIMQKRKDEYLKNKNL